MTTPKHHHYRDAAKHYEDAAKHYHAAHKEHLSGNDDKARQHVKAAKESEAKGQQHGIDATTQH